MSKVAWLDYDGTAREKAFQILAAFQEKESRDELGLGTVRDALSDKLFPGTSTIMTRLRYMLFVPWIFKRLENERVSSGSFLRRADDDERKLVTALNREGNEGVIGARAGEFVKRLPSDIYWSGLLEWGIRQKDLSIEEYAGSVSSWYSEQKEFNSSLRRIRELSEDLDSAEAVVGMWCATLPPIPKDFPDKASFELTKEEAMFLKERILQNCRGSVLATLASGRYAVDVDYPWELDFPEHRVIVYQAKMFSLVMYGATILYNVLLSKHYLKEIGDNEKSRQWVAQHEATWADWQKNLSKLDVASWDLSKLFDLAPSVSQKTRDFVQDWVSLVKEGNQYLSESADAVNLIQKREKYVKPGRSRFFNSKALAQWNGNSGVQFDYRWPRVRQFIKDLYEGLEAK